MGKAKPVKADPLEAIREPAEEPPMLKAVAYTEKLNPILTQATGGAFFADVSYGNFDTNGDRQADKAGYVIAIYPNKGTEAGCATHNEQPDFTNIRKLLAANGIETDPTTSQNRCGGDIEQRFTSKVIDEETLVKLIANLSSKKQVLELAPEMRNSIAAIGGDINRQVTEAEKNGSAPAAPPAKSRFLA